MLTVEAHRTIAAAPDEILELVMDVERYAQVDAKIRPVLWSTRTGNQVEFACRPRLAGLRQPKVVQFVRLTPGERIDIGLLPSPHNRLARAMADFAASVECTPTADGTLVTRRLSVTFRPLVRWLLEPLLRRRLPGEVADELARAKDHLEGGGPARG